MLPEEMKTPNGLERLSRTPKQLGRPNSTKVSTAEASRSLSASKCVGPFSRSSRVTKKVGVRRTLPGDDSDDGGGVPTGAVQAATAVQPATDPVPTNTLQFSND